MWYLLHTYFLFLSINMSSQIMSPYVYFDLS